MCAQDPRPSRSLAAPTSISAQPRLACPSRQRGTLGCDMPMPFRRLLPSGSKTYINTSLHARKAVVESAMAE